MIPRPESRLVFAAPVLVLALLATRLSALENDRQQDVAWSADGSSTMRVEENVRILEMSDNVRVTQGSLEILGDTAVFEYSLESNELLQVTVYGSPVHYQQQLDQDRQTVEGSSETIRFYQTDTDGTILELIGEAVIQSPDSTMACASIIYLADQDLIREAQGPCAGTLSASEDQQEAE